MKKFRSLLVHASVLGALLALFTACSDDDDNSPPAETTFPVTMNFYDIADAELLLWVGGEPVSTEGLMPEDLLTEDELFGMTQAYWENESMIFTPDSAYSASQPGANAYFFQNDSLFGTVTFGGAPIDMFLAVGNFSELRIPYGAYRFCTGGELQSHCGGGGSIGRKSFESVIANDNNLFADEFGPNDSMAVYNITIRFRP